MRKFVIASLLFTFSGPAQFAFALEEHHPGRHDIHSEIEAASSPERPSHSEPAAAGSHDTEADKEGSGKIGPNLAVVAADPAHGIKLSDLTARTIGLTLMPIRQSGTILLPREAIVHSKDQIGVYRWRDGWLKLILGQITSDGELRRFTPVKTGDLQSGDQVATGAVPIIRATDIYVFNAEEGEGH